MPASAVDGLIEINQVAVLAGGITPGDTPGFPATLSRAGSYRLTGTLDVTALPNRDLRRWAEWAAGHAAG